MLENSYFSNISPAIFLEYLRRCFQKPNTWTTQALIDKAGQSLVQLKVCFFCDIIRVEAIMKVNTTVRYSVLRMSISAKEEGRVTITVVHHHLMFTHFLFFVVD